MLVKSKCNRHEVVGLWEISVLSVCEENVKA